MDAVFYVAAVLAILATLMVITRLNAVHALLYLIVSLLSVAVVFYTLGAPFIAALEVIIYAGAIMVLFVFVVMMLNLGKKTIAVEHSWLNPTMWIGPCILAVILIAEVTYLLLQAGSAPQGAASIEPKQVGMALFGPYLIGVELASMLLLGAIVGAYHWPDQNWNDWRRDMSSIPMEHGLLLAGILFALGLIGLLVRRNLIFILMSIEVMLNAAGLAFVVAGSRWAQPDGQVMFIFILATAAAEVSVGLRYYCSCTTSTNHWMPMRPV